jgi:hypothetical protein
MRALILALATMLAACATSHAEAPGPATITFQNMYWGNETSRWTVPREGEGRYVDPQRTVTFHVSAETFDRVREILKSYETRDFQCRRQIADGPYGFVIWSSADGAEQRRTLWDAGCLTGDADDLFRRLDAAMEILGPLRDAAGE